MNFGWDIPYSIEIVCHTIYVTMCFSYSLLLSYDKRDDKVLH